MIILHFWKLIHPNLGQIYINKTTCCLMKYRMKSFWYKEKNMALKKLLTPLWKLYMHNISCFLDTAWRQALLLPIISSFLDIGTILCIVGSHFFDCKLFCCGLWSTVNFRFKYYISSFKFIKMIELNTLPIIFTKIKVKYYYIQLKNVLSLLIWIRSGSILN